ncbi:unnamed protein product [Caenorhabditis angaria]|uniref:Aspartyl/asparaginy/proline hydroxylase domain-containing protein n=1 Tax=Caenorhabditis angaria TaxID=860376 RepID=A0A9P1N970_9PELO|nr:unnamed protein product [Caenorhabditis angaria]
MATANGSANPVFRRQASTAGVNPVMTVALTPVPKVDYSVTKGGARTWIVLLVFVFLCSSLYTIFSDKNLRYSDVHSHRGYDNDEDNNYHNVPSVEDDDDDDDNHEPPATRKNAPSQQAQKPAPPQDDDDDEEEEETQDHSLGGRLFAGLRKKITDRLMETKSDEDEQHVPTRRQKIKEQKQQAAKRIKKPVKVEEEEEDDDDDDEDETPKAPEPVRKQGRQQQHQQKNKEEHKHKKYEQVKEEEEEDEDDDDEDDEEDNEENDSKSRKNNNNDKGDEDETDDDDDEDDDNEEDEKNQKKSNNDKKEDSANSEDDDEDDEDDDDDEDKTVSPKDAKRLRKQNRSPKKSANKECIHRDCPGYDSVKPRKSLLLKKRKTGKSVIDCMLEDEFDDDEDDDEDDDDDEEEDNKNQDEDDEDDDLEHKVTDKASSSSYKRHAITTKEEIGFRNILDRADSLVEKHRYEEAIDLFDHVITVYPASTRAFFGKARAYDIRGEIEANEIDRDRAIAIYEKILQNPATPEALFKQAAQKLIERTRFRGLLHRTLNAHRLYIDRFPEELDLQTDFAITFVMMKRYEDARSILRNVLARDQNNVVALAYYGYILKAHDDKIEQGVALMRKSLKLANDEIKDPKFFYQLGHGLTTLGKKTEADAVYQKAAQMGVFMTAQQRSLYNIDGLTARPWWSVDQTPYSKFLKGIERQWATVRQESMEVLRESGDCWLDHNQQLVIDGQWKFFPIMSEGQFVKANCEKLPQTCLILQEFTSSTNASKSEMYLSVLSSGGQILPHCGPTNYHLQAHLGLVSPSEARIRVGNETRGWRSGKFIVFDDSFEHELQFDGASSSAFRLVLVLQLWHPEVQPHQRVLSFLN